MDTRLPAGAKQRPRLYKAALEAWSRVNSSRRMLARLAALDPAIEKTPLYQDLKAELSAAEHVLAAELRPLMEAG